MTTLTQANSQWARRSPDERFGSLAAMHATACDYRDRARHSKVPMNALRVIDHEGDILLQGKTGTTAELTHWSFGQLCQKAGAPANYLRERSSSLAVACLNEGLGEISDDSDAAVMFDSHDGKLSTRALVSDQYTRIWNSDITSRLIDLEAQGQWRPAPAAFDGSRGLYLGDRDMFAFMVDNERRIFETLPGGGLGRGFFAWNSEVGATSFGVMTFLYEFVCGNHRVWGAKDVRELRIRHVGNADDRAFSELRIELKRYADSTAADDEQRIASARTFVLGKDKEAVLDCVFGLKVPGLARKTIEAGYDLAVKRVDWYGSPNTAWGLAGGLTEIARDLPNASERNALDRAASKVMEIAF